MLQTSRSIERRDGNRKLAAFTLQYHRAGEEQWRGGWTVDVSPSGAAFLAPDEYAPAMDEELEILAQQQVIGGSGDAPTPLVGRVTRVEDQYGVTRKIAVTFRNAPGIGAALSREVDRSGCGAYPRTAAVERIFPAGLPRFEQPRALV